MRLTIVDLDLARKSGRHGGMLAAAVSSHARVVKALMLRDLRTRFGRTFWGPVILVGWPLSHGLFLMVVYAVVRRLNPMGADPTVFFATGVLPYILCVYPSRSIMVFSIHANRMLLQIPLVKPADLLFAQCIAQAVISFWVAALFALALYLWGIDIVPQRPDEVIFAVLATIYLGIALGSLGGVMYAMVRAWVAVQILSLIAMYFGSGALILPEALPQALRTAISYNPLFHCVEWFRAGFYDYYSYGMLSRTYLLGTSTFILLLALLIERGLRGRLLEH